MHYAVPSILARVNCLERLYTDTYAPRAFRSTLSVACKMGPTPLRRWLARVPADIPEDKIVSSNRFGIEYYLRQKHAGLNGSATAAHLWAGGELCRRVINRGFGKASGVYTFNSAGLELLELAQARGIFAAMEQTIAPRTIEQKLMESEVADYPRWVTTRAADPLQHAFSEREQREWRMSDLILCGSEFVLNGIREAGGPIDRCMVVPYGIRSTASVPKTGSCKRPLRVLTVGTVGLRKGTPYVLAAAQFLKNKVEFRMVGSLDITLYAQKILRSNLELAGVVPRSDILRHFGWADVFLLPSICEGSATVCYEALAYGLPVIATPNTGSVVRDTVDGFIVPIRNSEAIVDRIERLAASRDLLATMSERALERASEYTLDKYGVRLLEALGVYRGEQC